MSREEADCLHEAEVLWKSGQALEAGRLIYEQLAVSARPYWAMSILSSVLSVTGHRIRSIEHLRRIAEDPEQWHYAHKAFSRIRKRTLRLERRIWLTKKKELMLCELYLAENAAKVLYNATKPRDAFDEDSGWWIASCFKDCIDRIDGDELQISAWSVLSDLHRR